MLALAAPAGRGQLLKRHVRAAAALSGLFDDTALADAVGVKRGTVSGWWDGAQPKPETLEQLARVTGLSVDELTSFFYFGGEPPGLPAPWEEDHVAGTVEEAVQRRHTQQSRERRTHPERRRQPGQAPRDT